MKDFQKIISFLKEKGFVYQSSQIYGGLSNSWDYGPIGVLLKENIKKHWKKFFIFQNENFFLFDSPILLNNKVWEASGHLKKFNDLIVICLNNNQLFRADKLINEFTKYKINDLNKNELNKIIKEEIKLKEFGDKTKWSDLQDFNLMFKVINSKQDETEFLYLRPETAQGIFIAFKNIVDTINPSLPFAIGQIGKSFRNEVTPGNFIFKTREFEQLELEYFVAPDDAKSGFSKIEELVKKYFLELQINSQNLFFNNVSSNELAHYSKKTVDVEYSFPFGKNEILGIADRGNFDLTNHQNFSGEKLFYLDKKENQKIIPNIIELSIGIERLMLVILLDSIRQQDEKDNERIILKLPYFLSPYKLAVAPLTNKLDDEAKKIYQKLLLENIGAITYTNSGTIGKRYYKQDAIGTPYTITIDFETTKDKKVTIRNRDTQKQERILIENIKRYLDDNAK